MPSFPPAPNRAELASGVALGWLRGAPRASQGLGEAAGGGLLRRQGAPLGLICTFRQHRR